MSLLGQVAPESVLRSGGFPGQGEWAGTAQEPREAGVFLEEDREEGPERQASSWKKDREEGARERKCALRAPFGRWEGDAPSYFILPDDSCPSGSLVHSGFLSCSEGSMAHTPSCKWPQEAAFPALG